MIVVFGSINVDLVFSVPHLPEAGETVVGENYEVLHGGKGANQAVAAAKAGATVEMVGCVGSDSFAHDAIQALRESGVGVSHVRAVKGPTGCAAIGVDTEGSNQILVAAGANGHVDSGLLSDSLMGSAGTVLLQMEVPPEANWQVIRRLKETGARVILNAAPATGVPDDVLPVLDLLVVNALEAQAVAASVGLDSSDPGRCGRILAERFGIPVAVTLGAEGSLLYDDGETLTVPSRRITPVDTTGAGDTFCGVLAAALDQGLDLSTAVKRANAAGTLSCLKPGARGGMPTAAEIDAALSPGAVPVP